MKDTRLVKILVEEKALVKLLKTIGRGRELSLSHERTVDKVRSIWIRTQITFKGTEKGTGRTKNC
jgi:hypothetical protein